MQEQVAEAGEPFEALVEALTPALLRLAGRFAKDGEEARELVQAALADAWERRASLRDANVAGPWLRRILVNRAINLHRRRRVWRSVAGLFGGRDEEDAVSDAVSVDDALHRARRLQEIQRAVSELPARQAAAVTLRYFEGLSLAEVADAMGIDAGTARVHLYRALGKLKALGAREREEA